MNNKIKRILYWDVGISQPPLEFELHPTEKNNLEIFPSQRTNNIISASIEMEIPILEKIFRQGLKMGVKRWTIAGIGEPMLLGKDLLKIMKNIKKYNHYGKLFTNGTLFPPEYIQSIVTMGWNRVIIYLPTPNEKEYDEITGMENGFEQVIRTINMFENIKDEMGSILPKIDIYMPITSRSYDKIGDMLKLAKRNRINKVIAESAYMSSTQEINSSSLEENQLRSLINKIPNYNSLAMSLKIKFKTNLNQFSEFMEATKDLNKQIQWTQPGENDHFPSNVFNLNTLYCLEPFLKMVFKPSGITPCPILNYKKNDANYIPLDTLKDKGAEDIWKDNYFSFLRERTKTEPPDTHCKNCPQHLRNKQIKMIKLLALKRERFVKNAIEGIMVNQKNKDPSIVERLERIGELELEISHKKRVLKDGRIYHLKLEKLRSELIYKLLKKLTIIRE